MKINSFLQNFQKLYQTKIKNNYFKTTSTDSANIFNQYQTPINEDEIIIKAVDNKQLTPAEKKHLESNPMLQAKVELKKLEKNNLETKLKAAKSTKEVNEIVDSNIINGLQTSKTNPSDTNISIEIAQNLRAKYTNKTTNSGSLDKKI